MVREADLRILTSIGLSKSEAIVFLDLVRHPESAAADCASRTGFHRPNIYDSIRRLKERGLVKETVVDGKTLFKASNPENLRVYIEEIGEELNKFIEDLKKLPSLPKTSQSISISEGVVALKAELINFLKTKDSPIYILGAREGFLDPDFLKKFHLERVRRKIPVKVIFAKKLPKQLDRINSMPYSEARFLNYGDINLITVVTGDYVYHVSDTGGKRTMIKIKHQDIAKEQKSHFDSAWKNARVV